MNASVPLAERMRPERLEGFFGQHHLISLDGPVKKFAETGRLPSMILWGPPGTGKTTLARILARTSARPFFQLSAIEAGVKEVRGVIDQAKNIFEEKKPSPVLFIDEIHRFSKSQQDSLLGAVEKGFVTLIGATTENPSFEVISPLLSRCQVFILQSLGPDSLLEILHKAIKDDVFLSIENIILEETDALLHLSGGDARKMLNLFELVVMAEKGAKPVLVNNQKVLGIAQEKLAIFDKAGEMHYDVISAFIKSMRGSDPNATVYWLARMIRGGEDPKFIARRMIILASEDIGNANPNALLLAQACFQAIAVIGMPEGRIILSQTAIYLACSPKSNRSYLAIEEALQLASTKGDLPVPLHLRNAVTGLMKDTGFGGGYQYAHDFPEGFVEQEFLPDQMSGTKLYEPGNNPREVDLRSFLKARWKEKYGYGK